jgi:tetratricopeptide (TPR) repeat protein
MSDEGERELFRLSAVRPAPYNFSGVASRRGFDTGASSAAPRGVESATEQRALFADAMRAYVDRNYDEASDLLHRVLQADPEASDANFYLGVILLLKGRPDQAVEPLRFAATNGRDRWSQPAHFYLAKTYLQTRDLASAESELKAAADIAGPWTGTAKADLATLQALRSREGR